MFGCCGNSQTKYIREDGSVDEERYKDVPQQRQPDSIQPPGRSGPCRCECHQDGKVVLC